MDKHALLSQLPPPVPPSWLKGGNLQTLYAKTLQPEPPPYRRELLPDRFGRDLAAYDFIDAADADAPLVVLFHGLEGSSRSHYAAALMRAVQAKGWHGVVAHFRSCGGVNAQTLYHSGDTPEVAHILGLLAQRYRKIYAVGVSLGGNVLAKYLGEQGRLKTEGFSEAEKAGNNVQPDTQRASESPFSDGLTAAERYSTAHTCGVLPAAAAVVSAPIDLPAAGEALEHGLPRLLYTQYFLSTLMKKVPYPPPHKIRSLGDFDNAYTAPVHGFADKHDYYRQAMCKPYLHDISVPTLLLNAKNDPFLPGRFLPSENEVSRQVYLLQPEHGGHVGFVSGFGRGHLNWLPDTLLRFFEWFDKKNGAANE
ncbi:MAG: alpha/beta hydrolase [Neisseria sp.]|nr:alpha/beta hydrolase [Neisseria sp.]